MQVIAPAAYPPHAYMDLVSACMPAGASGSPAPPWGGVAAGAASMVLGAGLALGGVGLGLMR